MKNAGKIAAILAVVVLPLTGCGTEQEPEPVEEVEVVEEAPQPEIQETAEPEPESEKQAENEELPLEQAAALPDVELTVFAVDQDAAPDGPQPDSETDKWVAVDHQICISPDLDAPEGIGVSNYFWSLNSESNHRFNPSNTGYGSFPEPAYAWGEVPLDPGECLRGWTVFTVNKDAVLTTVEYRNDSGDKATWLIP